MLWTKYLVAFALLNASPEYPVPAGPPGQAASLRPALQELAVQAEILDRREVRYVLARPEEFSADVALLRRRLHDLADAPPLADCQRLPNRAAVNEFLAFNRSYRQHLDVRQALELARWGDFQTAIQETDHLYQVWDTVRDCRCDYYYVTVRRQALKKLRELVGDEAYYTGRLPPYVPIWRFQEIDR